MKAANPAIHREQVEVKGTTLSYLASGDAKDETLVLLHGTFWSRVWLPVLAELGKQLRCVALDLPGFGRSDGELDVSEAGVPALAKTVLDAANALGLNSFAVAAHDIGGGIAQHLAAHTGRVNRMVLMNAVMFDSWPVPAVERFREPAVRKATTAEQLLQARSESTRRAVGRELEDEELTDYLSPWRSPARARSWIAMAAAADNKFTLELVPALKAAAVPTRLVWGRDDEFQKISYARRYVDEIPSSDLVDVAGNISPLRTHPTRLPPPSSGTFGPETVVPNTVARPRARCGFNRWCARSTSASGCVYGRWGSTP